MPDSTPSMLMQKAITLFKRTQHQIGMTLLDLTQDAETSTEADAPPPLHDGETAVFNEGIHAVRLTLSPERNRLTIQSNTGKFMFDAAIDIQRSGIENWSEIDTTPGLPQTHACKMEYDSERTLEAAIDRAARHLQTRSQHNPKDGTAQER